MEKQKNIFENLFDYFINNKKIFVSLIILIFLFFNFDIIKSFFKEDNSTDKKYYISIDKEKSSKEDTELNKYNLEQNKETNNNNKETSYEDPQDIFNKLNEINKKKLSNSKYFSEMKKIFKNTKSEYYKIFILLMISKKCVENNNFNEAVIYLEKALKYVKNDNLKNIILFRLERLHAQLKKKSTFKKHKILKNKSNKLIYFKI